MCRLYGFRANEPTKVECSLVQAQNALMAQSRMDQAGLTHGHGWGVAEHPDGLPMVEKQAWAAYHGERFKKTAARVYSKTVIAHVRRATVGAHASSGMATSPASDCGSTRAESGPLSSVIGRARVGTGSSRSAARTRGRTGHFAFLAKFRQEAVGRCH